MELRAGFRKLVVADPAFLIVEFFATLRAAPGRCAIEKNVGRALIIVLLRWFLGRALGRTLGRSSLRPSGLAHWGQQPHQGAQRNAHYNA